MDENSSPDEWELEPVKYSRYIGIFVVRHISCGDFASWGTESCFTCNKQVPESVLFQRNLLYETYKSKSK
ncbi:MAG: hypothetical protein AABY22_07525 [Nanoarchaeota archaeon]